MKDIELYEDIMRIHDIKDVVVGSIFGEERSLESVHFSDANNLFYNEISDELEIKRRLMKLGNVRILLLFFLTSSIIIPYFSCYVNSCAIFLYFQTFIPFFQHLYKYEKSCKILLLQLFFYF